MLLPILTNTSIEMWHVNELVTVQLLQVWGQDFGKAFHYLQTLKEFAFLKCPKVSLKDKFQHVFGQHITIWELYWKKGVFKV